MILMGVETPKTKSRTLSGYVTDYNDHPIANAVVMITSLSKSTNHRKKRMRGHMRRKFGAFNKSITTDKSGYFELTEIPPSKYWLEVFAQGYSDFRSRPFDLTTFNKKITIRLLKMATEEIVVTATNTPKLYAEVPVKVDVVTEKEMDRKHAKNLAESLSLTTGIRVENNCQNCNFTQVRINGMDGRYSQILIDSSPVFSAMVGVYGLEQIPVEILNKIEIVKGGGSALYGGNAVAGVINVLTKEPETNKTRIRFHQESISDKPFTDIGLQSSLVSKDADTKMFLFANYKDRTPVDVNDDGFSELGEQNTNSFGAKFYQSVLNHDGKLNLTFFHIAEERRGGNKFDKPPHQADIAEWIKSNLTGISSRWLHYLSKELNYQIDASLLLADRETYYGAGQDLDAYGSSQNPAFNLATQMNYQIGSNTLSLGVQYKHEDLEDKALGYGRLINEKYNEFGFFVQGDLKISEEILLLAGIRMTDHSLIENLVFNPRTSLLVKFSKDISWRTSFSTGFRAPQIFDEDLHITQVGGEGMVIINSLGLKEENSYSISTGIDFGKEIGNHVLKLSLEGFYTVIEDIFVLDEIENDLQSNTMTFERINGSDAEVYGAAIDFELNLCDRLSIRSGWTFQRSKLKKPEPDFGSTCFFRTPNTYGYFAVNFYNKNGIGMDISLEHTGEMKVPHFAGYIQEDILETTDPFWVLNAKIRHQFDLSGNLTMTINLGAYNLFDNFQNDLDQGKNRDAGYVYGPSKPRSYYASLEMAF